MYLKRRMEENVLFADYCHLHCCKRWCVCSRPKSVVLLWGDQGESESCVRFGVSSNEKVKWVGTSPWMKDSFTRKTIEFMEMGKASLGFGVSVSKHSWDGFEMKRRGSYICNIFEEANYLKEKKGRIGTSSQPSPTQMEIVHVIKFRPVGSVQSILFWTQTIWTNCRFLTVIYSVDTILFKVGICRC